MIYEHKNPLNDKLQFNFILKPLSFQNKTQANLSSLLCSPVFLK